MRIYALKSILVFSILTSATIVNGALIDCGVVNIKEIMIQADRDDNHQHANTLFIQTVESCNSTNSFFIKNNHPAYNTMVSLALTASATNKKLSIALNGSKNFTGATEISILRAVY